MPLFFRDYTTGDDASMYGGSSLKSDTVHCIYGDPNLIVYSPDWYIPEPVEPEPGNDGKTKTREFNFNYQIQLFLENHPWISRFISLFPRLERILDLQ